MGTLSRLSSAISRTSIGAMIVGAIAVYVFRLGDWTFIGTKVYDIFVFSTLVALFNAFINDLIIAPGLSGQVANLAKQSIMLSDDGSIPAGQVSFANEVIDAVDKREKMADRLSAVIGLVCYFVLGPRVGSPASEFITLAIFMFLPLFLLDPTRGQLKRMKALDSSIFEVAYGLYSSIHMAITNGAMK